ncbi:MAG: hypothetical protein OXR66_04850 [Candidatus Woesearchaeota archaeon]|nr:hypothetical protein [Candidatus Woesearchaeota archaeon]
MLTTQAALTTLEPLAVFVACMVVYAVFIFKFYRFIAKKDIFKHDFKNPAHGFFKKVVGFFLYVFKYIIAFPVLVFFWYLVLTVLLSFLSKGSDVNLLLMTTMGLVSAVRVTAYYREDLSKDLAKMLPFALLGVFLVDISYFNLEESVAMLKGIPAAWETILYYLGFVILLEFILRIFSPLFKKKKS